MKIIGNYESIKELEVMRMKITDYSSITTFSEDNIMIVDGAETGTRKILVKDAIFAMLHLGSVENHRLIFRGKNLGEAVTPQQLSSIKAGTFDDLWLGDYWLIDGVRWRIADFDYWYNTGNPNTTAHHIIIIPDTNLYSAVMNSSAITTGAYVGSAMYKTNIAQAKSRISTAFGSNVLSHKEYLTNTVSGGAASAGSWYDSTVELMNEVMLYGSYIETPSGNDVKRYTIDKTQLALFAAHPKFINNGNSYWLRDVVSATSFACVDHYGSSSIATASTSYGVRPVFAIG